MIKAGGWRNIELRHFSDCKVGEMCQASCFSQHVTLKRLNIKDWI